ncbi:MAG: hypothetical protein JNJ45_00600 [Chthonomonas sp.]|nr:hypothetical protein [Chthonomonas sp.]
MKTLTKFIALLALTMSAGAGLAQADVKIDQGTITISSRGRDVREILHDLFIQAGRSYVVEHNVKGSLFLALRGMEFDEVLEVICKQSSLDYTLKNDIYFFTQKAGNKPSPHAPTTAAPAAKPTGRLNATVLKKTVNTNFLRTDLRTIAAELGKQTGVTITIHADVPKYALDLVLKKSSLGYGLKMITEALTLQTVFTETGTINLVPATAKTDKH